MTKKNKIGKFIGTSIGLIIGLEVMDLVLFEYYIENKMYLKAFLQNPIRFIFYKLSSQDN